jgi:hypothetical protein
MGNLIKPSEYAKKLGISRQAVYAKIKKGILESKSIDGKLYIVHNSNSRASTPPKAGVNNTVAHLAPAKPTKDFRELLDAKDETIVVLKETITDLKETNKMITTTLRSEVDLLKEAFSEMKMLYSSQIDRLQIEETISMDENGSVYLPEEEGGEESLDVEFLGEHDGKSDELAWIELGDFFDELGIGKRSKQDKLKKKLKKLFKKGDSRVDIFNGELILLADADYKDVLKKKKK